MEITVTHAQGKVPVTVLQLHGELDGSNYRDLIHKAQQVFETGTRSIRWI
jgi:anti-anti-sigma regulatory factor